MKQWVTALNALTTKEQKVFYAIIHDKNFSQPIFKEEYGERLNHALTFYINMRNEITSPSGKFYDLKKEFDALPKKDTEYIKNSFAGVLSVFCNQNLM